MKLSELEPEVAPLVGPLKKVEDTCALEFAGKPVHLIKGTAGADFSWVINEHSGRIERHYKDGHIETEPWPGYDQTMDGYGLE